FPVAEEMIQKVRKDRRPAFLEARTPAWGGREAGGNPSLDGFGSTDLAVSWSPPSPDPLEAWHRVDPLLAMIRLALDAGVATREQILEIDRSIQRTVDEATTAARAASFPPPHDAFAHILAGGDLWPK